MKQHGILKKWNDERGFGFIELPSTGEEVFVHISEFPRGTRPQVGELVSFSVEANDGKRRATGIRRTATKSAPSTRRSPLGLSSKVVPTILSFSALVAIAGYGYQEFLSKPDQPSIPQVESNLSQQPSSRFKCDGRTQCPQMTSCEEAKYFLAHCPNVQMDWNGDGEPCEQQWCN